MIGLNKDKKSETWIITHTDSEGFHKQLEKQGEQKPADKVEPKFYEGDWVIDKQGIVHQIANVIENVTCHTYGYDIVGGGYFNDNTEGVRLWTIQDAKDGKKWQSKLKRLARKSDPNKRARSGAKRLADNLTKK